MKNPEKTQVFVDPLIPDPSGWRLQGCCARSPRSFASAKGNWLETSTRHSHLRRNRRRRAGGLHDGAMVEKNSATVGSNGLSKLPPTWNMPRFLTSQSSCSPWNAVKPKIYKGPMPYSMPAFQIHHIHIIHDHSISNVVTCGDQAATEGCIKYHPHVLEVVCAAPRSARCWWQLWGPLKCGEGATAHWEWRRSWGYPTSVAERSWGCQCQFCQKLNRIGNKYKSIICAYIINAKG